MKIKVGDIVKLNVDGIKECEAMIEENDFCDENCILYNNFDKEMEILEIKKITANIYDIITEALCGLPESQLEFVREKYNWIKL